MKGIVLLTNVGATSRQKALKDMAHGIICFTKIQKICITKRKDTNVDSLRDEAEILVIDPDVVPLEMAQTYIRAITSKGFKMKMIVFGTKYQIPGASNIACFKEIKKLAA